MARTPFCGKFLKSILIAKEHIIELIATHMLLVESASMNMMIRYVKSSMTDSTFSIKQHLYLFVERMHNVGMDGDIENEIK